MERFQTDEKFQIVESNLGLSVTDQHIYQTAACSIRFPF